MVRYIASLWPDADLAGWTGPGWYFWDETMTQCYGPYASSEAAEAAAANYNRDDE